MSTNNNKPALQPTFRKYADMTDGEKAAFRQGASMVDGNVQERLGLKKPRVRPVPRQVSPNSVALTHKASAQKNDFYKNYMKIKAKEGAAILFFRLGDFYEVLGDDAAKVSNALELTLTTRSIGDGRVPMCGVPYHSLQQYIAKLTKQGYKVVVADQSEVNK